jgi:hypothetical protein
MNGKVELLIRNYPNLRESGVWVETLGAKTAAKTAAEFTAFLRNTEFGKHFKDRDVKRKRGTTPAGTTRNSIDFYRMKKPKVPTYLISPGVGIPGHLNYLYGMAKGEAKTRSGKVFNYSKKRNVVLSGWEAWGGDSRLGGIYKEAKRNYMARVLREITQ